MTFPVHSPVCFLLLACVLALDGFEPPDAATRRGAIGDLSSEPPELKRAFEPAGFEPIPKPGPGDWLANQKEAGQVFLQFKASKHNVPSGKRRKLYIQPLGAFEKETSPSLDALKEFASAYFGMETVVLPPEKLDEKAFSPRENELSGKRQILTTDVMSWLTERLPEDAFCAIAVTMTDLYPDPSWNFVFGQASIRGRVGVYSFARYDPAFYGQKGKKDLARVMLLRSMKVLSHETGHMFGMQHCIFFRCCMNGSNNLEESDAQPIHLCPVCLRKLHLSTRFDVAKRYRELAGVYKRYGLDGEAKWAIKRAEWVDGSAKQDAGAR